jgi:hypothetical protein
MSTSSIRAPSVGVARPPPPARSYWPPHLAGQDVSTRWQDSMAELLEERVPDGGPPALEEIFRLD